MTIDDFKKRLAEAVAAERRTQDADKALADEFETALTAKMHTVVAPAIDSIVTAMRATGVEAEVTHGDTIKNYGGSKNVRVNGQTNSLITIRFRRPDRPENYSDIKYPIILISNPALQKLQILGLDPDPAKDDVYMIRSEFHPEEITVDGVQKALAYAVMCVVNYRQ